MDIFKLVGSVFVDTDEANKSLSKTDEKAEGLGTTFANAGKAVGKAALAIGTAAVGAGTALVAMANNAAETADQIDKGSIRMGVSTDYYQELAYAAGQCGVSMDVMEKAAKKLEGTDMGMEEALEQIMSLATEEERSAAAADLFGESLAYNLSPILASSGEDFTALMDRANELGIVMSEDSVAAGVKMGDTMSDVKQSFAAVSTELGATMMPIIQSVLDWVLEHMPEIKETINNVMTFINTAIEKGGEVMNWLKEKYEEYWPIIQEKVEVVVGKIVSIWENNLKPAFEAIGSFIKDTLWPAFEQVFVHWIQPTIESWVNTFKELWEGTLKPVFTAITDFVKNVFSGDFSGAFEDIKTIVEGIWNGLVTIIKNPINSIIGIINSFSDGICAGINSIIRALNSLQIDVPKWVTDLTGVTSFGFNIPEMTGFKIPLLASGGDIAQSGTAIVGENGPELLQLPKGARVTPLEENKQTTVNVTVDVHPAPGMDEAALASMVADRIQESIDRRAAAWA